MTDMSGINTVSDGYNQPYTPTTEEVRAAYEGQLIKIGENRFEFIDEGQAASEFDRWLAEVKAEAWEEGNLAEDVGPNMRASNPYRHLTENPYRQGESSGNGASQSPVESSNLLNGEEQ